MPPRRSTPAPAKVSGILDTILVKRKFKQKLEDCRIFEVWDEVAGEQITSKTEPVSLKNGVLKVTVSDHAWLQQLQFLKEEIRERLNKRVEKITVVNIFFQVGKVREKEKEEVDLAEAMKKVTLGEEEKKRIDGVVKEIRDVSVRATIRKAMVKEAKRKKLATRKD